MGANPSRQQPSQDGLIKDAFFVIFVLASTAMIAPAVLRQPQKAIANSPRRRANTANPAGQGLMFLCQIHPTLRVLHQKGLITIDSLNNAVEVMNRCYRPQLGLREYGGRPVHQPDNAIAICVGMTHFERTRPMGVPNMDDLPQSIEDVHIMARGLSRLGFLTRVLNNLSSADFRTMIASLHRRHEQDRDRELLIFFYVSGHGVVHHDQMQLVINEPPVDGHHVTFNIQQELHQLAQENNIRVVAVFDCCRMQNQGQQLITGRTQADNFMALYCCPPTTGVRAEPSRLRSLIKNIQDESMRNEERRDGIILFPSDFVRAFLRIPQTEARGTFNSELVMQFQRFQFTQEADGLEIQGVLRNGPHLQVKRNDLISEDKYLELYDSDYGLSHEGVDLLVNCINPIARIRKTPRNLYVLQTRMPEAVRVNRNAVRAGETFLMHRDLIELGDFQIIFFYPQMKVYLQRRSQQEPRMNAALIRYFQTQLLRDGIVPQGQDFFFQTAQNYSMRDVYMDALLKPVLEVQNQPVPSQQNDELTRQLGLQVASADLHIAVMFEISDYSNTNLCDLPNATQDCVRMTQLFRGLNFTVRNFDFSSQAASRRAWRSIMDQQQEYVRQGFRVFWAFYASSHGKIMRQQQCLLLNENNKAFHIEEKIRALLRTGNAFGLAIFDCCSFTEGNRGPQEQRLEDNARDNFIFLSADGPGTGVPIDSKLSYKLPSYLRKLANRRQNNCCVFPLDLFSFQHQVMGSVGIQHAIQMHVVATFQQNFLANQENPEDFLIDNVDKRLPHLVKLKQNNDGESIQIFERCSFGVRVRDQAQNNQVPNGQAAPRQPDIELVDYDFSGILCTVSRHEHGYYQLLVHESINTSKVFINGIAQKIKHAHQTRPIDLNHGDRIAFNQNNTFMFMHPVQNQIFLELRDKYMYPYVTPGIKSQIETYQYPHGRRYCDTEINTRHYKLAFLNDMLQAWCQNKTSLTGFKKVNLNHSEFNENPYRRLAAALEQLRDQAVFRNTMQMLQRENLQVIQQHYTHSAQLFQPVCRSQTTPFAQNFYKQTESFPNIARRQNTRLRNQNRGISQRLGDVFNRIIAAHVRAQHSSSFHYGLAKTQAERAAETGQDGDQLDVQLDLFLHLNNINALWQEPDGSEQALLLLASYPEVRDRQDGQKNFMTFAAADWVVWSTFKRLNPQFRQELNGNIANRYNLELVLRDQKLFNWQSAKYEWNLRKLEGKAKFTTNGWIWKYKGQFDPNGFACGLGEARNHVGARYFGRWKNNMRHGFGLYSLPNCPDIPLFFNNNEVYVLGIQHLNLVQGRRQGSEVITYEASNFEGHTEHHLITHEGFRGFGELRGGMIFNGQGHVHVLTDWMNLKWYQEGMIHRGQIQGNATYISELGHTWTGQWTRQTVDLIFDLQRYGIPQPVKGPYRFQQIQLFKKSGSGVLTLPTGLRIELDLTQGYPQGYGEIVRGFQVFEGQMNDAGEIHGYADMYKNFELARRLQFGAKQLVKNTSVEEYEFMWRNESFQAYHGNFQNGTYHGAGTFIDNDGWQFKGTFAAGRKNGYGYLTERDGTVTEQSWVSGDPEAMTPQASLQ